MVEKAHKVKPYQTATKQMWYPVDEYQNRVKYPIHYEGLFGCTTL